MRGLRLERALLVASALALACAAAPLPASAQTAPGPTAADRDAAAKKFAEGERAFKAGKFAGAGDAFEEANRLAPHPAPLWNAARARERAGASARAANLYARYLREAPAEAPNRKDATASLAALEAKLARVDVEDAGATEIAVDGAAADARIVYVDPGAHTVRGKLGGRAVERQITADAGKVTRVTLADPLPAPAPAGPPAAPAGPAPATPAASAPAGPVLGYTPPAPEKAPDAPAPSARRGWSPYWVAITGGLAIANGVITGFAVVQSIDAHEKVDELEKAGKPQNDIDAANDEVQKRDRATGFCIGATALHVAVTAVAAIWLVDWTSRPPAKVAVTPGGVVLAGSF